MSDTLKLALRISAIDLFSGVLRRFRSEIVGSGKDVQEMQQRYDRMLSHTAAGLKSLAVGGYLAGKLKPALKDTADLQGATLKYGATIQRVGDSASKIADEMARAKAHALDMSNLKFPAVAVMQAATQLAQSGLTRRAIWGSRDKQGRMHNGAAYMTELLAETKGTDPATTAQNVAKVGHAFGVPETGYGDMIDSIAKASTLGSADPTELFYTLNQSGAIAHYMGHMNVAQAAVLAQGLAPLGGQASASVQAIIAASTGARQRGYRWQKKTGFDFFDKQGRYIGLDAELKYINKRIRGMTEKQQDFVLGRDFGGAALPGLRLLMAVGKPGVKSYIEMERDYSKQPGLLMQNEIVSGGTGFQFEKFESQKQNLFSAIFAPLNTAIGVATKHVNEFTTSLTKYAASSPKFENIVSGAAGLGVVAAGGYGIYRLSRAGMTGMPLLKKFLRGTGNVAEGVAEGKAIEKLTGVVPVFVTNFPGGTFGAAATEAASMTSGARTAEAGAIAARVAKGARGFAMSDVLLAVGLAYALKPIKAFFDPIKDKEYAGIRASGDSAMAKHLGLNAQQYARYNAIEAQFPYGKWSKAHPNQATFFHGFENYEKWAKKEAITPSAEVSGTIHIQIDQQGRVLVKQLHSDNPRVHLDVGTMMTMP